MKMLALGLLTATLAAPALAETPIIYGGGALEYLNRPDGDEEPNVSSLEAYAEADLSGFYAGVWGRVANVDSYNRLDWYLGYRRDLDSGLSYSLGYYRYGYPSDRSSDYGELFIGVAQTVGDAAWVSLDLAYDPDYELANAYIGVEVYPADAWTVSANWGVYEVDGAGSEREWDIGATYALTDEAAVDLRWYDGSEYVQSYLGLYLSFDTTIFGG